MKIKKLCAQFVTWGYEFFDILAKTKCFYNEHNNDEKLSQRVKIYKSLFCPFTKGALG